MSWNGVRNVLLVVCLVAFTNACGSDTMKLGFDQGNQPGTEQGLAAVNVKLDTLEKAIKLNPRAYTRPYDIDRVEVVAQPADVTEELEYVEESKMFAGLMVVAVGNQVFTANAYDESNELVAQGSANAEVIANQTASVIIELFDVSGDLPDPTYGPIILSMTLSNSNPSVGEEITVSVEAQDPDGDPLEYLWEDDCDDAGFVDSTASSTTWTSTVQQACTLTVTVTGGGLSDSEDAGVVVFPNSNESGAADIEAEYFPNPMIYNYYINFSSQRLCQYDYDLYAWLMDYNWVDAPEEYRSEFNGTCDQLFTTGEQYEVWTLFAGNFNEYDATMEFEDDCGGLVINTYDHYGASCNWPYRTCNQQWGWLWRSPNTPGLCTLTVTLTAYDLQDTLSFVVSIIDQD